MKILITGGGGQLAWELGRSVPANVDAVVLSRDELDIADAQAVSDTVARLRPDAIINAAAYTNVDGAQSDEQQAFRINGDGPRHLANACTANGAYLLHISTDFVFDGRAYKPYKVDAKTAPLGVYGASKLAGEHAVKESMGENWSIIRTAWVYSTHGSNFVKTMLRLMKEKPALNIIADQIGSPTWAHFLAGVCWQAVAARATGTFHYTGAGVASWYDFAVAIQSLGLENKLLDNKIPITPIPTEKYPTPASRPAYSVLDNSRLYDALPGLEPVYWRDALEQMVRELAKEKV